MHVFIKHSSSCDVDKNKIQAASILKLKLKEIWKVPQVQTIVWKLVQNIIQNIVLKFIIEKKINLYIRNALFPFEIETRYIIDGFEQDLLIGGCSLASRVLDISKVFVYKFCFELSIGSMHIRNALMSLPRDRQKTKLLMTDKWKLTFFLSTFRLCYKEIFKKIFFCLKVYNKVVKF